MRRHLPIGIDTYTFILGYDRLLRRVRYNDPAVRHPVRYAHLVRVGHFRRTNSRRLIDRRVIQIIHARPSAPLERLRTLDFDHLESLVPTVRVHLAQVRILLGVAGQQVNDVVVRDGRDIQRTDIVVVRRVADAVPLRGYDRQTVLRTGRNHRSRAEGGVTGIKENVLLGEGVLRVARRLEVDVGDARVLDGVVLGVRLVQVVVGILAGVIAHAATDGDAGDLEGRRLLPALVTGRHVAGRAQANRLVQLLWLP